MPRRPFYDIKWPLTPTQVEWINDMFRALFKESRNGPNDTNEVLDVEHGGTGKASFTPYAVVTGGTTTTGPLQNVSGVGTDGQVLVSQGSGALPAWETAPVTDHNHTSTAGDGGILTNDEHDGYSEYEEIANPGTPTGTKKRLWVTDLAGHNFFAARDSDGRDLLLARDNVITVRNTTGSTISKGAAVYFNGSATGNFPHVALAQADSDSTMPAIGLAFEDISNNSFGRIMVWGRLGLDTSSFSDGDLLYVSDSVAGALTTTAPTATGTQQQRVGVVAVSSVGNGAIVVTQTTVKTPVTAAVVEALGYWVPLTDGDEDEPFIIFADAEPVMVFIPT